jgi:glycosyltransferase involved in cell wall biosynthesis
MNSQPDTSHCDYYLTVYCDAYGWGGALSFTLALASALDERGHSSLIIGTKAGAADPPCPAQPDRLNVPLTLPRGLWRLRSWCAAQTLARQLRRIPPPNIASVAISPFWLLAARQAWPEVPAFYKFPCLLANCQPFTWPNGRPPSFWQRVDSAGIRRAERQAFMHADLTIAPTPENRAEILAFAPHAAARVVSCHYGVRPLTVTPDLRAAHRGRLALDPDTFLILLAGPCDRNKAFDLAIRVLPQLDPRAQLAIVGDGPLRPDLLRLADALGLAPRIHCPGPQHDIAPWYAAADCVLSTSFYDTCPNVIREAMLCGRPVVLPRHDPPHVYAGLAEFVATQGGGRTYDRRRPESLVQVLNQLIHARAATAALGQTAQRVAHEHFRWERFLDLILARPPRPAPCHELDAVPATC